MNEQLKKVFFIRKIYRIRELKSQGYTRKQLFIRFLQYLRIYHEMDWINQRKERKEIEKLHKRNNKLPIEKECRNIAVIETGVLGDSMLVVSAFQKLADWCKKQDYVLDIVCSSFVAEIFRKNAGIGEANYICFQNRNHMSSDEYEQLACSIARKSYRYVLVRDSNPTAFRIAALFRKKEAIYYSYDANRRNKADAYLAKKYFTEIKNIDDIYFIPQIWKLLLERIGVSDYKTALGHVQALERTDISTMPYIVLSPEASTTDRNLTKEQCMHLVTFLTSNYPQYRIVVSSTANSKKYTDFLYELIKQYNLIDCVGNTTMQQYISVIAGAKLVIGCDSGTIHLSAALGVQAVCCTGYWDRPYFVPYEFDVKADDDKYPLVLYARTKPACAYCGTKSVSQYLTEYVACQHLRDQQSSFYCIASIDKNDIEAAVVQSLD